MRYSTFCPRCRKKLKTQLSGRVVFHNWLYCREECGISIRQSFDARTKKLQFKLISLEFSSFEIEWLIEGSNKKCFIYTDIADESSKIKIKWLPYNIKEDKIKRLLNLL